MIWSGRRLGNVSANALAREKAREKARLTARLWVNLLADLSSQSHGLHMRHKVALPLNLLRYWDKIYCSHHSLHLRIKKRRLSSISAHHQMHMACQMGIATVGTLYQDRLKNHNPAQNLEILVSPTCCTHPHKHILCSEDTRSNHT